MPNKHFCQGPYCHTRTTQDRFLKSRGVIRGKYAYATLDQAPNQWGWQPSGSDTYFCSQGCYNDFANTYVREVIALHPRTEALETPIDVVKEQATDWSGNPYIETKIIAVDNNGG